MGFKDSLQKIFRSSDKLEKSRKTKVDTGYYFPEQTLTRLEGDIFDLFKEDAVIFGACSLVTNWITATNAKWVYDGRTSGKIILKEIEEWAGKIQFEDKKRTLANTLILYGNVFVEVVPEEKNFYLIKPETIKAVYKLDGNVSHYIQQIQGGKEIRLDADRVVHLKMNTAGEGLMGISPIEPLRRVLRSKRISEQFTNEFFLRHATPRLRYSVPDSWTDEEFEAFVERIKTLTPHSDMILNDDVSIEHVGSKMTDMQFQDWLAYIRREILTVMGVPPVMLSEPQGSNKAVAETEFASFRLKIKAAQKVIDVGLNHQILPKVLGPTNVRYQFGDLTLEETHDRAEIVQMASQGLVPLVVNNVLTKEEAKEMFITLVEGRS